MSLPERLPLATARGWQGILSVVTARNGEEVLRPSVQCGGLFWQVFIAIIDACHAALWPLTWRGSPHARSAYGWPRRVVGALLTPWRENEKGAANLATPYRPRAGGGGAKRPV
jgi:hypothetical protein